MRKKELFITLVISFLTLMAFAQSDINYSTNDFEVHVPDFCIQEIPVQVQIDYLGSDSVLLHNQAIPAVVNGKRTQLNFENGSAQVEASFDRNEPFSLKIEGFTYVEEKTPMPLWLSIIPPLLVILIAFISREVISSLTIGIISGIGIMEYYTDGGTILSAFPRLIDTYLVNSLANEDHIAVIVFSTLIGGMVAVISKNGGMAAVVQKLAKRASTPRSGQLVTWFLGMAIFFDDYANTLVVGNTMRPLTDKLKISREKLSYIVDSTAAPVAAIAFITTWIGAELGYIQGALDTINSSGEVITESAYGIFFGSLQYSYYPLLCLFFMFVIIWTGKDFGPMFKAEKEAHQLSFEPDGEENLKDFEPVKGIPLRPVNAVLPIITIILVTIIGLFVTGDASSHFNNPDLSFGLKLSETIGNADSYKALLWASLSGLVVALLLSVGQRILTLNQAVESSIKGFKSMMDAIIILILAWALAGITDEMHTADYLAGVASGTVSFWLIPAITFVISGLVAFSTGSSWGTMAIIYPLMLPLTWAISIDSGQDAETALLLFYNTTSCVLAGSVLGDHCSPISDTTILSSLATRCDHVQHVRTQLPYALAVGSVALALTIFSSLIQIHGLAFILIGAALLYLVVKLFGKRARN